MKCDGYEMFHGTVRVLLVYGYVDLTGIWLYRPDVDCWYCKRDQGGPGFAESYPPDILSDFRKDDDE